MSDGAITLADATRAVLLAVRLRPVGGRAVLEAALTSMSVTYDDLDTLLGRLELAGLLEHRQPAVPEWRLTSDGRHEGERLLAQELDRLDVRAEVTSAYEQFVSHNGTLLRACTDWQLRDANPSSLVVNDHTDTEFDRDVIRRLGAVHAAVLPICDELTARLGRFLGYRPRFTSALERIRSGDLDAFDKLSTDSDHSIWFELHEHVLATVGRDRSTEPLPEPATTPLPPA